MRSRKPLRFGLQAFLESRGDGQRIMALQKQQALFAQGDSADAVFYIRKGKITLTVLSKQRKKAVIATLGPGDFFGEGCLAGQRRRMATATATTDGSVVRLKKRTMIRLLHDEPTLLELFMSYVLSHNVRVEESLVDQLFGSSEQRLARTLLLLAHAGKDRDAESVVPRIRQETLAKMIGATRARVSFIMNRFKKLGLIEYNGGLRVHSELRNVVLHD
ncbi:MAG: Crp/Fnr family transcriptional regulator [bacterium]|nr:Crp/Fnr family transcriptional regulator [bacterium]